MPLHAPFNGTVLRIHGSAGTTVESSAPLFELGEPGAVWAVADVFEKDIARVAPGAEASIELPIGEGGRR